MPSLLSRREAAAFLEAALECSVYVSPRVPGLTHGEALEVALRAGLKERDMLEAIVETGAHRRSGNGWLMPKSAGLWGDFSLHDEPDYRNIAAFDFVARELRAAVRAHGVWGARVDRTVIVERAFAKHIPRNDVEAALTIWLIDGHLRNGNGGIGFATGREQYSLPSEQQRAALKREVSENPHRRRAFPLVEDVCNKRGRGPRSKEIVHMSMGHE